MSCADTDGVIKQARTTDASVRVMHLESNIHSRLAWISTLLSGHTLRMRNHCVGLGWGLLRIPIPGRTHARVPCTVSSQSAHCRSESYKAVIDD